MIEEHWACDASGYGWGVTNLKSREMIGQGIFHEDEQKLSSTDKECVAAFKAISLANKKNIDRLFLHCDCHHVSRKGKSLDNVFNGELFICYVKGTRNPADKYSKILYTEEGGIPMKLAFFTRYNNSKRKIIIERCKMRMQKSEHFRYSKYPLLQYLREIKKNSRDSQNSSSISTGL